MKCQHFMKKSSILIILCLAVLSPVFGQTSDIKFVDHPASKKVDVTINGKLFTSLLYADSLKKHVLYPIIAKNGATVTRGYPVAPLAGDQVDHPHQIGLWFNYGDVNGADYWNNSTKIDTNKKAYGTIKLKTIKDLKEGKGKAELTVLSTWYNPGGKAVLAEESKFVFREEGKIRLIERFTTLKALTDVSFKDNKEGLFGMRVARQLEHPSEKAVGVYTQSGIEKRIDKKITTGNYESSTGIKGEDVFGTRAPWLKLSGRIDGKPVAVVIMDSPQNLNYPGFWMARGYGLFAINPLGAEFYTNGKERLNSALAKGRTVTFNYAVAIADELTKPEIEALHKAFVLK